MISTQSTPRCLRSFTHAVTLLTSVALVGASASALPAAQSGKLAIKAGKILADGGSPAIENGVIVIENGRITAVGDADTEIPWDAEVIDAPNSTAFPGYVDAHTFRGTDRANENIDVVPFLKISDSVDPVNAYFEDSLRWGVTTLNVQQGNQTVIAGQGLIVKPIGMTVEEMLVSTDAGLKISASPKRGKSGATQVQALRKAFLELRQHLESLVQQKKDGVDTARREALFQGREFEGENAKGRAMGGSAWKVEGLEQVPRGEVDEKQAPLLALVEGNMAAFVYCGRALHVPHALEVARDNGFLARTTMVLAGDAWKAADRIAQAGVPVIWEDDLNYSERDVISGELSETYVLAEFDKHGVRYALSGSGPGLWYGAALAVGHGTPRERAIAAVTSVPAEILGLGERVGSLEVGKDGNVLLLSGDPLSVNTFVERVVIEGVPVYDRASDIRIQHLVEGLTPPGTAPMGQAGAEPKPHEHQDPPEDDSEQGKGYEDGQKGGEKKDEKERLGRRPQRARRGPAVRRLAPLAASAGLLIASLAVWAPAAASQASTPPRHVAVHAGTIHVVPGRQTLTGGATLLVRDGRVVAAGADLAVPPDAQVIDYGPDAVIVPGLVAASSVYALGAPAARTAAPGLRAVDNFDPGSRSYARDLSGGVTSAYIAPARGRLIAGQGAVVKLAGDDLDRRIVLSSAALQGSIGADARSVPGYWDPPIPASVDVGLGRVEQQLPGSLMGAMTALHELLDFARGKRDLAREYGPETGAELEALLRAGVPLRMVASSAEEIRALLDLATAEKLDMVIEGGERSAELAGEIARAGASVVLSVNADPQEPGRVLGREKDSRWPRYDQAQALAAAGVSFAIATTDKLATRDLLFAAALASRGGLSEDDALRAITIGAAEVLGVQDRLGSLEPGKDADFAVMNGAPLATSTSMVATWIDGARVWKAGSGEGAVVIEVDELHIGDGNVISPGQVLLRDGRVAEVGRRVGHPRGALVVRGPVAMPGMIDATGHLGLEGTGKTPATDFKLARVLEPPDHVDRKVALGGVTTVVLAPRGTSKTGTPMMAYKPAGGKSERRVVADPTALRLTWTNRNRAKSGDDVRALLEKAHTYDKKWREYEAAIAKWKPAPAKPAEEDAEKDSKKEEEDEEPAKKESKSKKKKGKEPPEVDPFAGIWEADLVVPPAAEASHLRLRMERSGDELVGSLRCAAISETLVELSGTFEDGSVSLRGLGSRGWVSVEGKPAKGEFEGRLVMGASELALEAERTSTELPRAARSESRREKQEKVKEPKGKPKEPGRDEKLEPLRRAMHGQAAVVVAVDRREEIRECVEAFEKVGIRPVLLGADDAWRITDELVGRVAGVILSQTVFASEPRGGLASVRNRYAELAAAGIPLAFQSNAEEGAAELPITAAYAVSQGLSSEVALRSLCADAARMFAMQDRVGRLTPGLDGDVLLLDGPPLDPRTRVLRAWVGGEEVR